MEPNHKEHESAQDAHKHSERSPEHYIENEAHRTAEMARNEAIEKSRHSKVQGKEKRTHQAERHNTSHITAEDREASFEETMDHVRKELPRSTRGFSRFIHSPAIEAISEFLGKTIFRPDAVLAGGITAFVVVLGLYFYAKYAGFSLRGSETIIAFAVGWLLGILFDFFRAMFTGKR
jgi:hypothetical protein